MYIHIAEMLARNARLYPDDIALIERIPAEGIRREISWRQFDERANRFANALLQKGLKKGSKVAHLLYNSIDWLIAYFGIVKTGGWVVPLNFRYTGEDIKYCLDVAQPEILLFGAEFTDRIEAVRDKTRVKHYICRGSDIPDYADPFAELLECAPATPLNITIKGDDPCGLYFSSGTTGRPKPVLLTHGNMVCAGVTEKVHHGQTRDDNFILIPPLYHTGPGHTAQARKRGA
jgi:acyl-CoA synthetase (AMP-forming)/AMP-acid ligase II